MGSGEKGLDFDKLLEASFYGAVSAVAFSLGEFAACPSNGSLDHLGMDIAWAVFGALFSELVACLTDNTLLTVIVVGFITGFLVVMKDLFPGELISGVLWPQAGYPTPS
jgi:hypothetical protein